MFDVDEPISDYQKAVRERAAESLGNLLHTLSQPAKSPQQKDDYSTSVVRLKKLLKKYNNEGTQHQRISFQRPSDSYEATGPQITVSGYPTPDEVASLVKENHAVLLHLEEQLEYYKNALTVLRQRSELVIGENETLYEQLKVHAAQQILQDETKVGDKKKGPVNTSSKQTQLSVCLKEVACQTELTGAGLDNVPMETIQTDTEKNGYHRMTMPSTPDKSNDNERQFQTYNMVDDSQIFFSPQERKFVLELEKEVNKIRKLHEAKCRQLEALLYSTRDELEDYQKQVAELQSKLRAQELVGNLPGKPTMCVNCANKEAVLSTAQSQVAMDTVNKLVRERNELMESLTRQKATLADARQRELEAYVQAKKSVETVEQAQLEKAEAIIHAQQLKIELKQQKERHEKSLTNLEDRRKKENDEINNTYRRQLEELSKKLETTLEARSAIENQLERLTREKVGLTAELEKARSALLAHEVDTNKMDAEIRSEMADSVTKYKIASQEITSLKASAQQTARDREQERARLTAEMSDLRRRLQEAEGALMEQKEECIRLTEKLDSAEREIKIAAIAKNTCEKARKEDARIFTQQAQQKEQQLTALIQQTESRHAKARVELEQILESQIQVSNRLKEECKALTEQLRELAEKTRSEVKEAGQECSKLREKLLESSKKQKVIEAQCLQRQKTIENLSSKLKQSDSAAKKYVQQVYELLTKQNRLMKDRQMLCRELEYLRSQTFIANQQRDGTPLGTESCASAEIQSNTSEK